MNEEKVLDWDDEITKDDEPFEPLEEGDYAFKIINIERARFEGSDKMPACPKAIVHFEIIAPGRDNNVELRENFLLHTKMEWKLSQLFASVGLKKKGEPLKMDWQALPGLQGKCKVKRVKGFKDESKIYNQIDTLYPGDGKPAYTAGSF